MGDTTGRPTVMARASAGCRREMGVGDAPRPSRQAPGPSRRSQAALGGDTSGADGGDKRVVVALVLIGIGGSELGDRLIEHIAPPRYAAMAIWSPEQAWARASVHAQSSPYIRMPRGTRFSISADPSSPAAGGHSNRGGAVGAAGPLPAQEDVAGGLHQLLAGHYSLARGCCVCWPRRTARVPRASASFTCRNSGSDSSLPSMRTIQRRVPTLPTPTTLRASLDLDTAPGMLAVVRRVRRYLPIRCQVRQRLALSLASD